MKNKENLPILEEDGMILNGHIFHPSLCIWDGSDNVLYCHNNEKLLEYLKLHQKVVNKVCISLERITHRKTEISTALNELLTLDPLDKEISLVTEEILYILEAYFSKDFTYITGLENVEDYQILLNNNHIVKIFLEDCISTSYSYLLILGIFKSWSSIRILLY